MICAVENCLLLLYLTLTSVSPQRLPPNGKQKWAFAILAQLYFRVSSWYLIHSKALVVYVCCSIIGSHWISRCLLLVTFTVTKSGGTVSDCCYCTMGTSITNQSLFSSCQECQHTADRWRTGHGQGHWLSQMAWVQLADNICQLSVNCWFCMS